MQIFVFYTSHLYPHFCTVKERLMQSLIRYLMFKHCLILFLILLFSANVEGQGWERVFGGGGQDQINAVAPTHDGGYIMTGFYGLNQISLIKADADGTLQWSKNYPVSPDAAGTAVVATQDSGYAVAGYIEGVGAGERDVYLFKTDAYGNVLWAKTFGGIKDDEATGLLELADGSLVICGFTTNFLITVTGEWTEDIYLIKTDAKGNPVWTKTFGQQLSKERGNAITTASNGGFLVAGSFRVQTASPGDVDFYAVRFDALGNPQWDYKYGFINSDDVAKAVVRTTDGNFVLAGGTNAFQGGAGLLMKIDGNGSNSIIWQNTFPKTNFNAVARDQFDGFYVAGRKDLTTAQGDLYILHVDFEGEEICNAVVGKAGADEAYSIIFTPDGGAAAAGYSFPFFAGSEQNAYLVKADLNCEVFTSYIKGNIFQDLNNNCLPDIGEAGLEDWVVKIVSPNFSRFAVANENGDFRLAVDTGQYELTLFAPNEYWQACDAITNVTVPDFYDTVNTRIPVRVLYSCPRNEVDVATPVLRRCNDNLYTIRYCNTGSVPSQNTRIEVSFDPALTVTGSSIPGIETLPGSNNYVYNVGTLPDGECETFTVTAFLDCDNVVTGQTHCVTAHIYPDTFCNPGINWDGSIIRARAICDGDTMVRMYLHNITANKMNTELDFVIAEDLVMLTVPGDPNFRFKLEAEQDTNIWSHKANNGTYRIIAQQSPGYPGSGYPTAAVEGCKTDTSVNPISLGFYTMFPEDDADAFVETDCQESYETDYNPTYLKRGHPKGYDVAHYVSPETDLDYLIQFRNTGTTTVQQIIIRDTLSTALDPATVHPGAASHPYDFEVYGQGIVQFTLPNVNLAPGSSASEGFVKFRVSQKPNIECGTTIFNSAAIYFDFNAPVITNQTFHTTCIDTVFVQTKEIHLAGADVRIYPNPVITDAVNFEVMGVQAQTYGLHVYDAQGRLLSNAFFNQPTFRLFRHQLPAGVIFYRLTADGKPVASGKLIAQ